jgi:hypothetical protein
MPDKIQLRNSIDSIKPIVDKLKPDDKIILSTTEEDIVLIIKPIITEIGQMLEFEAWTSQIIEYCRYEYSVVLITSPIDIHGSFWYNIAYLSQGSFSHDECLTKKHLAKETLVDFRGIGIMSLMLDIRENMEGVFKRDCAIRSIY